MPSKPKRKAHPSRTQFKPGNPHAFKSGADNPQSKVRTQSDILTRLASQGIRDDDLRRVCGISSDDWPTHKQQHPDIQDAIDAGRAKMHDSLVAVLYKNALKGQLVPALFLLKTQFSYRENDPVDNNNSNRVTIIIPGADRTTPIEGERLRDLTPEELDGSPADRPRTVSELFESMGAPAPTHIRTDDEEGRAYDKRATHKVVGKALIPLNTSEYVHQAAELAAGRADPFAHPKNSSESTNSLPPRETTDAERQAFEDAEAKFGIRRDRNSFDSEAAWNRYNRAPPTKQ
jgi:hypothetical protein